MLQFFLDLFFCNFTGYQPPYDSRNSKNPEIIKKTLNCKHCQGTFLQSNDSGGIIYIALHFVLTIKNNNKILIFFFLRRIYSILQLAI